MNLRLLTSVVLAASLLVFGCSDDGGTGGTAGTGATGGAGGTGGSEGVVPRDCFNLPDTSSYSVPNAPPTSSEDCTTTLSATGTDDHVAILEAIVGASANDVICFNPGEYDVGAILGVSLVPGLTLKGLGDSPDDVVFDFKERGTKGIFVQVNDVTVENMWIKNTAENAVEQAGTSGSVFRKLHVSWDAGSVTGNGAYAVYADDCSDTTVEYNQVSGASDTGLYVDGCEGGHVNNNWVHANVAGIEVENSLDVEAYDNLVFDNTGGLLALQEPISSDHLINTNVLLHDNEVFCNNRENFAQPGSVVGELPQGTGTLIFGSQGVEIRNNIIDGNISVGVLIASNVLLCQLSGQRCDYDQLPGYNPYPEKIYVHDNIYINNGTDPKSILGDISMGTELLPLPDVIWDGFIREGVSDPEICLGTETPLPTYLDVTQNQCQRMNETETLACILDNATEDPTGRDCVVTLPVQEPDPI
jgi:parallel beta-helix repeat protein